MAALALEACFHECSKPRINGKNVARAFMANGKTLLRSTMEAGLAWNRPRTKRVEKCSGGTRRHRDRRSGAGAAQCVSPCEMYDYILETAVKLQGCQASPPKVEVGSEWRWLLEDFAEVHKLGRAYPLLARLKLVMRPDARSCTPRYVELIWEEYARLLQEIDGMRLDKKDAALVRRTSKKCEAELLEILNEAEELYPTGFLVQCTQAPQASDQADLCCPNAPLQMQTEPSPAGLFENPSLDHDTRMHQSAMVPPPSNLAAVVSDACYEELTGKPGGLLLQIPAKELRDVPPSDSLGELSTRGLGGRVAVHVGLSTCHPSPGVAVLDSMVEQSRRNRGEAATRIQAVQRGRMARRIVSRLRAAKAKRERAAAAVKIQSVQRGRIARKEVGAKQSSELSIDLSRHKLALRSYSSPTPFVVKVAELRAKRAALEKKKKCSVSASAPAPKPRKSKARKGGRRRNAKEYLDSTVTPILRDGMFALDAARPVDPIEFLCNFFMEHKKSLPQE
ncbi:hypothetical protein BSKO_10890 [Bryopsis sp. KO-2023]|nr:hypothetical protein BSKO_10890 [Bryopsis sp. KO-2023]